jgi:hypothetical protein
MMICFGLVTDPYDFCTGGFAPGFIRDWWDRGVATGEIVRTDAGYRFSTEAETALLHRLSVVTGTPAGLM